MINEFNPNWDIIRGLGADLATIKETLLQLGVKMSEIDDVVKADAAAVVELKASIATMQTRVSADLAALTQKVADLTAQVANGTVGPDTLALATQIGTDLAAVKTVVDGVDPPAAS